VVHGPAHEDLKLEFLSKLASFYNCVDCPYIVGVSGYFNIMRNILEKNKPSTLPHSSEVFTSVLREIHMIGGKYTWSNKQ
jgi:hypothetical protein